jgi:hypothetical protein
MANPDASFGFRPYMPMGGYPGRIGKYTLSSAYNTALFQGDLVKSSGTGSFGRANVNISTGNTDQILGVFHGVEYTAPDGSFVRSKNWTASTATKSGTPIWAYVYDDPNMLFIAQCDGTTVVTDIGAWAGVVTTNAGNATTGISGQEISTGQGSETTFKIVRLIDAQDMMPCRNSDGNQDFFAVGANGLVVVRAIKHELAPVATVEV